MSYPKPSRVSRTRCCVNALYGDAHSTAYLLDPRCIGDDLAADARKASSE